MGFARPICLGIICLFLAFEVAEADTGMPPHGDGPLKVRALVYVIDVQSIDSAKQHFTANIFYRFTWHDPRLAHEGPGAQRYALSEVWHPGMQVLNRERVFHTFENEVYVSPAGEVTLRQRLWGDFTQPLDLREFPFDEHRFMIRILAIGYDSNQVVFVQDPDLPSLVSEEQTLTDWEIKSWKSGGIEYKPIPNLAMSVAGFEFSFLAHRDIAYYIYKVIIPLLLLVLMSWIVFWVNVEETGTQISVSITTILTLTAYRFALATSVPAVSYMTRMDNLILSATLMTFAALGLVIVISYYKRTDRIEQAIKVQTWSRVAFPILLAVLLLFSALN